VIGSAVNLATGIGAETRMTVGSISGNVTVPGGLKQTVVVGKIVNVVTGIGAQSCVSIGYGKPC